VEGEEVNDFFVGRKMRVAEVRLILLFWKKFERELLMRIRADKLSCLFISSHIPLELFIF
jgi:hypothetical protein